MEKNKVNSKKDIILGLDVGIASVGWCITNKDNNSIIKHGVRLFDTVDHPKDSKLLNETRRQKRSERRMKKRKNTLKRDFIKFLIENKYIKDIKIKDSKDKLFVEEFKNKYLIPMDKKMNQKYSNEKIYWIHILRKKALKEKIEFNQLISILYWYLSNRGFKYEEREKKETDKWNKLSLKEKEGKLPIELLIKNFKKTGRTKSFFNRNFHKNEYLKELKQIFETQNIDKKLTNAFLNESKDYTKTGFFNRQRSFEIGPGGIKSPTPYGLYAKNENGEIVKKYENIWEKTIGKCSEYPNKDRAPKDSFSAEVFNLLNDLNNITFGLENQKLTTKDKLEILKISFNTNSNFNRTIKYITNKYENISKEDISGFRFNTKKEPILTKIKTKFNFNNFEDFIKEFNSNKIDDFVNILNKTKEIEKRKIKIQNIFKVDLDEENLFKEIKNSKINFSETHSLSYKALKEYIPELLKQNENYSTLSFYKNQKNQNNKNINFIEKKYLDKKWIEELIASPNTKRGLFQTTGLLNEIIKYCQKNNFHISKIVVEMTRQTNNKKERENIQNFQKHLKSKKDEVSKILKFDFKTKNKSSKSGIFQKVYLWLTQDLKDIYDGEKININDLKNNPHKYDIDHILPKSKSFDDSINNKVLTKNINNSKKGNKTPYQWLSNKKFLELSFWWKELFGYDKKNKKNKNIKKLQNLLFTKNFDDPNEQLFFIQRNLVDTSYISKAIMNKLKNFFTNKDTMIQTINGKMTNYSRKYIEKLNGNLLRPKDASDSIDEKGMKNRIWHGHHAEDAYFLTLLSQTYRDNKIIEKYSHLPKISKKENSDLNLNYKWEEKYKVLHKNLEFGQKELNDKINQIKFSRKLELNSQLKGSNEKLIGAKLIENKKGEKYLKSFKFYQLIDMEKKDCEKYFNPLNKNSNNVALKEFNESLYDSICKVYKANSEFNKPFQTYLKNKENLKFIYKNKEKKDIEIIVNKVKIFKENKDIDAIFFGNNKNKNSFYENLNWLEIRIYKNKKGNYQIIPINIKNAFFNKTKFEIRQSELDKMKKIKNIDIKNKHLWILKRNDIILKDGIEYFICGCDWKKNILEIKYLSRNKTKKEKNQIYKTINTKFLNSEWIKKDFMGNIIKRTKLFIKNI